MENSKRYMWRICDPEPDTTWSAIGKSKRRIEDKMGVLERGQSICFWTQVAATVAGAVISNELFGDGGASDANAAAANANNASAQASRDQTALANDQWNYYKQNFQPLESGLVAEAKGYGSPAEVEKAAADAHSDVTRAYGLQRDVAARNARSFGLDPSSGRYVDAARELALSEAASDAGAQNIARQGIKNLAFGKKLDVVGIGKGIPASASAGLNAASANISAAGARAFQQGQALGQQFRQGTAPITSAISKGIRGWFDPATSVETVFNPPSGPSTVFGADGYPV